MQDLGTTFLLLFILVKTKRIRSTFYLQQISGFHFLVKTIGWKILSG